MTDPYGLIRTDTDTLLERNALRHTATVFLFCCVACFHQRLSATSQFTRPNYKFKFVWGLVAPIYGIGSDSGSSLLGSCGSLQRTMNAMNCERTTGLQVIPRQHHALSTKDTFLFARLYRRMPGEKPFNSQGVVLLDGAAGHNANVGVCEEELAESVRRHSVACPGAAACPALQCARVWPAHPQATQQTMHRRRQSWAHLHHRLGCSCNQFPNPATAGNLPAACETFIHSWNRSAPSKTNSSIRERSSLLSARTCPQYLEDPRRKFSILINPNQ